jgi:zinc protease
MSGLRELSGAELATDKRNADFYGMLNSRKNFSKLEIKGKEKVGSSDAYVVVATPAVGDAEKHYFAADTGLLVRVDSKSETPQGKLSFETYFSDYKEVDGIKIAHLVRQVSSAFIAVIKLSEVKHNVEVADAKFNLLHLVRIETQLAEFGRESLRAFGFSATGSGFFCWRAQKFARLRIVQA